MPTYEFKCEEGHVFSELYKHIWSDEDVPPACPECGKETIKLINAPGVSGFIWERVYQAEKDQVDRELRGGPVAGGGIPFADRLE